jgi:hypothetical protein
MARRAPPSASAADGTSCPGKGRGRRNHSGSIIGDLRQRGCWRREGDYPCDEFIEANVEDNADTVKWLLDEIKDREEDPAQSSNALYTRDQLVQWALVVPAFLLTLATAITKAYPELRIKQIDFGMIPIALAALSAAVTSLNVYYQFDEYRRLNQMIAYDLAELKSDINFAIFRHAASRASNDTARINEDAINEWHERFDAIMQRYLAS